MTVWQYFCNLQLMTSPRCGVPDLLRRPPLLSEENGVMEKKSTRPSIYRQTTRRRRTKKKKKTHLRRLRRFVVGGRAWTKRRITYLLVRQSAINFAFPVTIFLSCLLNDLERSCINNNDKMHFLVLVTLSCQLHPMDRPTNRHDMTQC